jgi:hypothetical protein
MRARTRPVVHSRRCFFCPDHFTGDSHANLESSLHRDARAYLLGPRSCHFNRANDISGKLFQVVLARRSARFHCSHGHAVPAVYEQCRPRFLKKSVAGASLGEGEKNVLRPSGFTGWHVGSTVQRFLKMGNVLAEVSPNRRCFARLPSGDRWPCACANRLYSPSEHPRGPLARPPPSY